MRKLLLLLLALLTFGTSGVWADVSDFISTDFANAKWLRVTNCTNSSYVMYAKSSTMGTQSKTTTAPYPSVQLVAFIGTSSSFKIYSYNLGSSYALKAASETPEDGTTVSWVAPAEASTWTLVDTYANLATAPGYGICLSGQSAKSLNMYAANGGDCKFYTLNETNKGSRWALEIVDKNLVVEDGKVYKISSYQNTPTTYQIIYSSTATDVISKSTTYNNNQGYWVCHVTNGVYTFESAMANGYNLGWFGVSTTPYTFDLKTGSSTNAAKCLSLYSHEIVGGDVNNGRYLYVHKSSGGTNNWNRNSTAVFADAGSTDYLFEEVNSSVYKVVSNINDGGVIYNGEYTGTTTQTNNGFFVFSSAPDANDFDAISKTNYGSTIVVNSTTKTITVTYTATITYTLKDVNEQEYSWSASGSYGIAPTLTGCAGYTLSNEVWNAEDRTYTADISFPFPVSSNSVTNWTYIGSFHNKSGYPSENYLWRASGTDVIVNDFEEPTNESGEQEKYLWTVIPAFSNGAFTFTIKNAVKNASDNDMYIYSNSSTEQHKKGEVILSETASPMTYETGSTTNCGTIYMWHITSINKYISVNSVNTHTDQYVGTYSSSIHDGLSIGYHTPANFSTLKENLETAYNTFNDFYDEYNDLITAGTYTETSPGSMASAHNNNTDVYNVIKDGATDYIKATQFTSYINAYNNAVAGVTYVMPTGKFIRIKNVDGSKYVKASTINYAEEVQLAISAGGTDATSIFYMDASNKMIAYKSGSYLFATNTTGRIANNPWVNAYEFLIGASAGQVLIHAKDDPTGWGIERYWTISDDGNLIDRVSSAENAIDFLIESVTSLPVTITSAKWATLYSPVALTIPTGVTAYTATKGDGKLTLNEIETTIPKNTGVILFADVNEATTYNFSIASDVDAISSDLTGSVATVAHVADSYVLGNGDYGIAFYGDYAGNMTGFKAYLPNGAGVKAFVFDLPTAIEETINNSKASNGVFFDLSGRRINKPSKGIYVVNGQKVIVK